MKVESNFVEKDPLKKTLIHHFRAKGKYYLFDASTSTALETDDNAFRLVQSLKNKTRKETSEYLQDKYSQSDLQPVWQELLQLKRQGLFCDYDPPELKLSLDQISSYRPHHFVLMVTEKCNLRCKYCYENGRYEAAAKSNMPEKVAYKAVDFLLEDSSRKECNLTFFGGEPLINSNLIRSVVDYAKCRAAKKGKTFRFSMTTNGILLKEKIVEFLEKEKFRLLISFDGPQEIHDLFRIFPDGSGSFDVVRRNLKKLQSLPDFRFSVRATLTNQYTSLRKLARYFEKEGFSRVYIQPISSHCLSQNNLGLNASNNLTTLYKEYDHLAEDVLERWKNKKPIVFNPYKDYLEWLHKKARRILACGVCRGMLTVGADGLIYPCQRFAGMKNFIVGDVDHWIDARKIHEIYQSSSKAREVCSRCWAVPLCAGGCMHDWANEDGSFNVKEPENCEITRKLIELSIYLYSRLVTIDKQYKNRGDENESF